MKIDINKKYCYRMGEPVRILCVDAVGPKCQGKPQPVAVLDESVGEVTFHFEDGKFDTGESNIDLDLIEVREPREWEIKSHPEFASCIVHTGPSLRKGETIRVREIID